VDGKALRVREILNFDDPSGTPPTTLAPCDEPTERGGRCMLSERERHELDLIEREPAFEDPRLAASLRRSFAGRFRTCVSSTSERGGMADRY